MKLPHLPQELPFDDKQTTWLAGFFAGLHSRLMVKEEQVQTATQQVAVKQLTILYGSQTGNAESVAYDAAAHASEYGLSAQVIDMDAFEPDMFKSISRLLIVTSTYGEGEMPDNAESLWQAINSEQAPSLNHLYFSVLALGDTSYDEFCLAGELWDRRLEELGATRVTERVNCDVDYEDLANDWISQSLPHIARHGSDDSNTPSAVTVTSQAENKPKYTKKSPLMATLASKYCLTENDSSKQVMHYEIDITGSGETYQAGDVLNILPKNNPELVNALLKHINYSGDEVPSWNGESIPLRSLLSDCLEIRTPSKELVKELAEAASDHKLLALIADKDNSALNDYLWGKDLLAMLQQYPEVQLSLADLLRLLKPIAPRAYSISSSERVNPDLVSLTVACVRYSYQDRLLEGTCSTWLSDQLEEGQQLACFFTRNKHFAVPENPEMAMIMVGPGTGIAPFRAFLQARAAQAAKGKNWLFFGDRNKHSDFLYQQELEAFQQSGLLTQLDLAFSRDQKEKVYVQDKMLESGAQLFEWLQQGAYFYVCGDATYMAKDVDLALHQIVEKYGRFSPEQTQEYINHLKKNKRYVRDVY